MEGEDEDGQNEYDKYIDRYNRAIAWDFSDLLVLSASLLTVLFIILWPLILLLCTVYRWTGNVYESVALVWSYTVFANILAVPLVIYYFVKHNWKNSYFMTRMLIIFFALILIGLPLWVSFVLPSKFYTPEFLTIVHACSGWNTTLST